jgi:hypothetical protein
MGEQIILSFCHADQNSPNFGFAILFDQEILMAEIVGNLLQ